MVPYFSQQNSIEEVAPRNTIKYIQHLIQSYISGDLYESCTMIFYHFSRALQLTVVHLGRETPINWRTGSTLSAVGQYIYINIKKVQKQDIKNIKNVKRCRDGMPKSMQTR